MFGFFGTKETDDFKDLIKNGAIVVDVRSKEEFAGGHIAHAVNIPLDTLPASISKLGGKDTCVITCCMSGGRSSMAKNILYAAGYSNIYNGGGWQQLQSKLK